MNYNKLLLDELRFVAYEKGTGELTEELLAKAVTMNENLQALGYTLSPMDIAEIAVSPSLDGFYDKVKGMMDAVKAAPMYPGFPEQVMEMDEAVFRFHQMVHYFSTYGMELLFGVEVKHGWLPCENENTVDPAAQKIVLKAKTIKLLPVVDMYLHPLRIVLSRKERMTLPEKEIITEAISHVSPEQAGSLAVGFKENMNAVYAIVFDLADRDAAFMILRGLCQHTGDVLRCVDVLLGKNKYHFRTSQKRFLVKLLESYPVKDLRANLVLSGKGAERNILLLNYIDYSVYSRSESHMAAVNDLRDGKLHSWESIAKMMLRTGDDGALDFIAQRPGMMLRMVAWLMRLGYTREAIVEKLSAKASALSMQTLVTNLNHFGKLTEEERADTVMLYTAFEELLHAHMGGLNTVLRGKKVMVDIRELNDLGVDVIFEKENIRTQSTDGELLLTILAGFAEEEALSASKNQLWRIKKNFEEGKSWTSAGYGYRQKDGVLVVEPEEAEVIRQIYEWYIEGLGHIAIAKRLREMGILNRFGKNWTKSGVEKALKNYTYTGNLLLQKTYSRDFITKQRMDNHGEKPMYHVEESHEAIISDEDFLRVQEEHKRRDEQYQRRQPVTRKPCIFCGYLCKINSP